MSRLICKRIEPFYLYNGFKMESCVLWQSDCGKNMLISIENGTTLIIDDCLKQSLLSKKISDDFQFLLVQRGMATAPGANRVIDQNRCTTPSFFLIDMTNGCNLGCKYCFRKPENEKEVITEGLLDDIIIFLEKYINETGLRNVTVQPWGGEPLIAMNRIVYFAKKCHEKKLPIKIIIETNGVLITRRLANILKKYDISVGISIDGTPEIHDVHRPMLDGSGSLIKIKEGINILRDVGYSNISSISVVTKNTVNSLSEVINFLADELKINQLKLNIMKKTAYNDHELALEEDINKFASELVDIVVMRYKNKSPIIEANILEKMNNLLLRRGKNICISKGCSGGRELVSINRKGEIYPCEMSDFPEECLGTIYDKKPLSECIIEASHSNDYFKAKKKDECSDCSWWYFCRGGCSGSLKYTKGIIKGVDENECRLNKAIYPKLVDLILTEPEMAELIAFGGNIIGR